MRKAFTLVELIVVITILAILGTVAFISLQGYTREARDSKRLSDVNNIFKKISLERTKGTYPSSFMLNGVDTSSGLTLGGAIPTESKQGTINFLSIKEDESNFKDPKGNDYVMSYAVGGSGTGAYKFIQLATINEEKNEAVLVGDYYKMQTNDSPSLVYTNPSNPIEGYVEDKKSVLPYSISSTGGSSSSSSSSSSSGGPVYSCDDNTKPTDNGHITFLIGTPTSENQAYIKDELDCGYSCLDGYIGNNCEINTKVSFTWTGGLNNTSLYTIHPSSQRGYSVNLDYTHTNLSQGSDAIMNLQSNNTYFTEPKSIKSFTSKYKVPLINGSDCWGDYSYNGFFAQSGSILMHVNNNRSSSWSYLGGTCNGNFGTARYDLNTCGPGTHIYFSLSDGVKSYKYVYTTSAYNADYIVEGNLNLANQTAYIKIFDSANNLVANNTFSIPLPNNGINLNNFYNLRPFLSNYITCAGSRSSQNLYPYLTEIEIQ